MSALRSPRGRIYRIGILFIGLALGLLVHAQASENKPVILIVGDSLSAGYGIDVQATWVALLERRLVQEGYGYRVVNASASGETTGGARARLPRALQIHRPRIVVLELGGNDGLRGLPLGQIKANLDALIEGSKAAGAKVVLVGMRIPPNYGPAYAERFHALYGELAKKHGIAHVDFFLEGVALDETLMQPDGIHPSAAAQGKLLDNVWPALRATLEQDARERSASN
nr:arylesterase [Gammaproteobacteria bacterium]